MLILDCRNNYTNDNNRNFAKRYKSYCNNRTERTTRSKRILLAPLKAIKRVYVLLSKSPFSDVVFRRGDERIKFFISRALFLHRVLFVQTNVRKRVQTLITCPPQYFPPNYRSSPRGLERRREVELSGEETPW